MTSDGEPADLDVPARRAMMLYVNIPFCKSKCAFCDYVNEIPNSDLTLAAGDRRRERYIDALCHEIRVRGEEFSDRDEVPNTLYWGGGTASILEEDEIRSVMDALKQSFDLGELVEATIECSPSTITPEKLALFREVGFDRFSSGVQSFDDDRLKSLGRRHSADEARRAVRWAREQGFDDASIDIMCGFPDETLEEVKLTVSEALETGVDHLSLYPFRPTPGTTLRKWVDQGRADLAVAMQKKSFSAGRKMIVEAGYEEYASGYFGRPSVFAIRYFQRRGSMVGMGSGAVSNYDARYRVHAKGEGKLDEYIASPTEWDVDIPASADPVIISGLRAGLSCFDGIRRDAWEHATGEALDVSLRKPIVRPLIEFLRAKGLVEDERGVRLPRDKVGDLLIELQFHLLKQQDSVEPDGTPVELVRSKGARSSSSVRGRKAAEA